MDLLPTGSDKILEIYTEKLHMVIRGARPPGRCAAEKLSTLEINAVGLRKVEIPGEERERQNESGGLSAVCFRVRPLFFEETGYEVIIRSLSGEPLTVLHESDALCRAIAPAAEGDLTLLTGVVSFGGAAGYSELAIAAGGVRQVVIRLEVFPSVLTYREDHEAMLSDIARVAFEAVLDTEELTYRKFAGGETQSDTPLVFFRIIRPLFEDYLRAARRIAAAPHHRLAAAREVLPASRARTVDKEGEKWLAKHPDAWKRSGDGIRAGRALAVTKRVDDQTDENRMAAWLIRSAAEKLEEFERRCREIWPSASNAMMQMAQTLRRLLAAGFPAEAAAAPPRGAVPPAFGMAPGYRELYRHHQLLTRGLSFGGDAFQCALKDTAVLYEYWCFLTLAAMLRGEGTENAYRLASPDVVRVDRTGVSVTLAKGESAELRFLNARTGERLRLVYQPEEMREDGVILLEKYGGKSVGKYLFAPRYRLDEDGGPRSADIGEMHRLRDAVGCGQAYVLFPAHDAHPACLSAEKTGVGGLPLLPGDTAAVKALLDNLLSAGDGVYPEKLPLPPETQEALFGTDWRVWDVMVGSLRNEMQYAINLEQRFYHTAVENVPAERLPVRYIALCRSKAWENPGVYCYGEVIETKVVKRSEIPVPSTRRHNDEAYYLFRVKSWQRLPAPIVVKEEGVYAPRFTNLFLLQHAQSTQELFQIRSAADYRLSAALGMLEDNEEEKTVGLEGGYTLWARQEEIDLVNSRGAICASCKAADLARAPGYVFRSMKEAMQKDGRR